MILNPFSALGEIFLGLIKQGKIQAWVRLGVSVAMSMLFSGLGTWAVGVLAGESFMRACAEGTLMAVLIGIALWMRSPLSKGIPLMWPGRIEAKRIEMMQEEGTAGFGLDAKK